MRGREREREGERDRERERERGRRGESETESETESERKSESVRARASDNLDAQSVHGRVGNKYAFVRLCTLNKPGHIACRPGAKWHLLRMLFASRNSARTSVADSSSSLCPRSAAIASRRGS